MDDQEFLLAFEAAAIPAERWTHRDHVRMAFLYLRELPFEVALARMRAGITALNVANGGQNTATSGYHETVTVAWATIIADAISAARTAVPADRNALLRDADSFIAAHPELLDKQHLRRHYSKDRLLSVEARAAFVPPDLEALPPLSSGTVEALLVDLLQWLAHEARPYDEVMAAWRTSCPRLPIWEEANARGLLERHHDRDGITRVSLTPAGRTFLQRA